MSDAQNIPLPVATEAPEPAVATPVYDHAATARQVNAGIFRICQKSAFFAALALHARIEIREDLPTAATDGRSIFVNPGFFDPLTLPQRDGLLLHEVLHAALHHVQRRASRDPRLWNIAADIVVNGIILDTGLYSLPEGGVIDASLQIYAVEEVYELLLKRADTQQITVQMVDLLDESPNDGQPSQGAGSEAAQKPKPGDAKQATEGKSPDWQAILEKAKIITRSSNIGSMPDSIKRELAALGRSTIDWRSYLWRFMIQTPTDFGSWDRRFIGDGLYLETLLTDNVRVALCVDTSGSIDTPALTAITSEVRAILQSYPHLSCDLYYADSDLHGPYPLRPDSPLPEPIGGGGTDFKPFFARLNQEQHEGPALAVYLTDGWGDFPKVDPGIATLWAVLPGGRELDDFPFGEALRMLPNDGT